MKTNKYLKFIKLLFAKIFKKEYNIIMINEEDKPKIYKLYYEDFYSIEAITQTFNNQYDYETIKNFVRSYMQ